MKALGTTSGSHVHGPGFDQEMGAGNRDQVLGEYRDLLESIWEDGIVTDEEFQFLRRMRKGEGITMSDHLRIEMEVREKMLRQQGQENYPCPSCANTLQYVEEYDNWYCWTCEDYKY